jgi:hypothetical protein
LSLQFSRWCYPLASSIKSDSAVERADPPDWGHADHLRRRGGELHDAHVRAERRGRIFILAFACGCALSSAYGFLAGTWPFGVVEAIWALVALRRYRTTATPRSQAGV